jgi:hypothetical protein
MQQEDLEAKPHLATLELTHCGRLRKEVSYIIELLFKIGFKISKVS